MSAGKAAATDERRAPVDVTVNGPGHRESPHPSSGRPRRFAGVVELTTVGLALLTTLVVLYPLLDLCRTILFDGDGLPGIIRAALDQDGVGRLLLNTAIVVLASSFLALVIACAFAWFNERTDAGIGAIGRVLPVVSLLVPPIAGAIGWMVLLSPRAGYLNWTLRDLFGMSSTEGPFDIFTWYGLIGVYTVYLVPQAYLLVAPAIRNLDPSIEEAAFVSGAGAFRTFARVVVPSIRPALVSAWTLMMIFGLALFSVPVILGPNAGIEVLSVRIVRLLIAQQPPQLEPAIGLSLFVVVAVAAAWIVQRRVLASARHVVTGGRQGAGGARVPLGRGAKVVARAGMAIYLLLAAVVPFCGLLLLALQPFWLPDIDVGLLSLDNFRDVLLDNVRTREAITFSVRMALTTAIVALALSMLFNIWARVGRPSTRRVMAGVSGIVKIPASVSHMILAVGFIAAFAGPPFRLSGTATILLIAYVVTYLPQASLAADAAVAQIGDDLFEAAAVSGASSGQTIRRVALPLSLPALVAGGAIVFAFTVGDLTLTRILAGTNTPAIGFVLLDLFEGGTFGQLAALAVLMSLLSTTVVSTALFVSRGRRRSARRVRLPWGRPRQLPSGAPSMTDKEPACVG